MRSNANYRQLGRVEIPTLAAAGVADPVTQAVNMRLIANRMSLQKRRNPALE